MFGFFHKKKDVSLTVHGKKKPLDNCFVVFPLGIGFLFGETVLKKIEFSKENELPTKIKVYAMFRFS